MITDTQIVALRIRYRPPEEACIHCERCIIWSLLEHIAALQVLVESLRSELRRAKQIA